jgi:hypothetical protein
VTKLDSLLPEDKCQIAESRSEDFFEIELLPTTSVILKIG